MDRIGFMGGGKMAAALLNALLKAQVASPDHLLCSDVQGQRLDELKRRLGIRTTADNRQVLTESDIVFLAFKPQNFPAALEGLGPLVRPNQLIVSILAGVRIGRIRRHLPGRVVRVMPNTACLIGQMAAGYATGPEVDDDDRIRLRRILDSAGTAVEVEEDLLDAVTGLSGSGPAFVAYLIDCFCRAGTAAGLSQADARALTLKTFAGTAQLLDELSLSAGDLIEMVTSPGGTTQAGRDILESSDAARILRETIRRATERSRELGRSSEDE
ncbi:MAG: pyrroline-5-carboxylate reductase [Sedimentisphaerales bacterium]|nr:pyrroline-5-carboxylate reductase [Sedimentisphaerales bacterium]